MNLRELLVRQSELTYHDLRSAIQDVEEPRAWGIPPSNGTDYLHTNGSILSLVLHAASAKAAYGSFAFRNSVLRWRDIADEVEQFEPNWEATKAYSEKCHKEWMECWSHLYDGEMGQEVLHFSGNFWPAWKIISTVIHHDAYHAGQIQMTRFSALRSNAPPPATAEDIRQHCKDLPTW